MSPTTMHKGEFVAGMAVRPIGSMHVMTLGGTAEEWICSWYDNDEHRAMRYMPEDLEPVCMLVGDTGDGVATGDDALFDGWVFGARAIDDLRVSVDED
ncbi:MAG TPA: hypothetical protein VFS55_10985 [Dokdonella sp.]|nr:hypothetical protein [Dokdonella sp.]